MYSPGGDPQQIGCAAVAETNELQPFRGALGARPLSLLGESTRSRHGGTNVDSKDIPVLASRHGITSGLRFVGLAFHSGSLNSKDAKDAKRNNPGETRERLRWDHSPAGCVSASMLRVLRSCGLKSWIKRIRVQSAPQQRER